MSVAILLAPGDVIKCSTEELRQRHIQINLVDWEGSGGDNKKAFEIEKQENRGEEAHDGKTQSQSGKEEESGAKAEDADVAGRIHTSVGSRPGAKRPGEGTGESANGRDRKVGGRDRTIDEGDGADGAKRNGWVVLSDEIARAIDSKYGTKVEVYADEPTARIIEIERSLQKELGITREGVAEQTERLRELKRREGVKNLDKAGKQRRSVSEGGKKRGKETNGASEGAEAARSAEEEKVGPEIEIEKVMSQKKLLSMIGGAERRKAPIGARDHTVALVSNSLKDVRRATAYFTAPTGDPNWKEVAREASKKQNILAYSSTGGDTKTEFLHLIDHL
uniref:VP6 protein n=1 Tax=Bluetongue virus TaxID=40051 RepID=A0A6B9CYQ1_BTV|nr:VP6 protein [Bluetongue virus]